MIVYGRRQHNVMAQFETVDDSWVCFGVYAYGMVCIVFVCLWSGVCMHIYQGRSTNIKTRQAIDDVPQTRGVWGHAPPGKFLKSRCSVSTFSAILGNQHSNEYDKM